MVWTAVMTCVQRNGPKNLARKVTGKVKWFDAVKGYGFIVADDDDGDVLLHFSVLREVGRRSVPEGYKQLFVML